MINRINKKLLIVGKTQFGYHTDSYKYCEYLSRSYDVKYICFDSRLTKLKMDYVQVTYISNNGPKLLRGIRFILRVLFEALNFNGLIFIIYFEGCSFIKRLLPWKKMILDVRTLSINSNSKKRGKYNLRLKNTCRYFDFVTVISEGLRNRLELTPYNSSILPLGSDILSVRKKDFTSFKLLYVGTLNNRNISQTIEGFYIFLKSNPRINNISYDIIGDGNELIRLKQLIESFNLSKQVTIHGRIPHFELKPFFENCNIGISYVPMTDYYEYQPVTKTFEYILSGMVCIATNTYENSILINENNGVLCDDNPKSFAKAIEEVVNNHAKYDSNAIRNSLKDYSWGIIVENKLKPVLEMHYS